MPGVRWAPSLSDVARHIPSRTRDFRTPGSSDLLMTFTERTTPTSEQAQSDIDAATRTVLAEVGEVPEDPDAEAAARDAAEWRAAADIELAYPDRDADVLVARDLDQRAKDALERLKIVLMAAGAGAVEDFPQWSFPPPWPQGDAVL